VRAPSPPLRRWAAHAWPMLQGTAAATAAWAIAKHVVHHREPFFAPISAVVALNASVGERGSNTIRLLVGVVVGIIVGELTIAGLGGGYGSLALATFAAMAVARALGGARIVIAQAAASAILTVAVAHGDVGLQRLVDALIGAGVALVFSQFLSSPEPLGLLRRAEAAALAQMADMVELGAGALDGADDETPEPVMRGLRDLRERLADVDRMRHDSIEVARHSGVWRSRIARVRREKESAGHLEPLGVSCLMLTRTAMGVSPPERRKLASNVRELAGVLRSLAANHGDHATRQRATDTALEIARCTTGGTPSESALAAIIALRMMAVDLMVFAGADPREASAAVRDPTRDVRVTVLPPSPRMPFSWRGKRPVRRPQ
jgi:uncharacterized membrane protein YgaE (UPF0421/DUF939 family)